MSIIDGNRFFEVLDGTKGQVMCERDGSRGRVTRATSLPP
jgi:hypothetical protein